MRARSERTCPGSQLEVSCIYSGCPLSLLAVYFTTGLIKSVFHGGFTGGGRSSCRMRNHVVMLAYVWTPPGACLAWLSEDHSGLINEGRPLRQRRHGTARPSSNPCPRSSQCVLQTQTKATTKFSEWIPRVLGTLQVDKSCGIDLSKSRCLSFFFTYSRVF